jgi:hypothetical protein
MSKFKSNEITIQEQNDKIKKLEKELEFYKSRDTKWSSAEITLYVPTKEDPLNHYDCRIIDVGYADAQFSVECPELELALHLVTKR